MIFRILVLEPEATQRSAIVSTLERLGVTNVLEACNSKDAMALIRLQDGVDVVICDVSDGIMDHLPFLRRAGQFGRAKAVILIGEMGSEPYHAVEQIAFLSGLELLAALSKPVEPRALHKVLQSYSGRCNFDYGTAKSFIELPSEDDIRRGLALGQFIAYFQPKCALDSGAMVGAEVLVRWQHPTKGLLLPKDFLAAVLAYDLLDEVTKHLLEQGMRLQATLRRQSQRLGLSVNLHASQLIRDELTKHVQQRLKYHELSGADLTFELAENGLLDMQASAHVGLIRLRMMGCNLAIDDFGVGFSSLKLLCQLPFTQIKLDGSFVQELQKPENRAAVISALVLAKSLNMELIVEGVNNQLEHEALLEMGCLIGQGVYYGRPMTAQALIPWIAATNRRD